MTADPLNCSILALRAKGDRTLAQALGGLNVMWMTAREDLRPERMSQDIYLVAGSVSSAHALDFYAHVRAGEANAPVILVCGDSNVREVHEKTGGDRAAHVAMSGELAHVRQLVEHILDGVRTRLMDARLEEVRTLLEELAERQRMLASRSDQWKRRLASSEWLAMRMKSMEYFTRTGTAAQFDRLWPGVCAEALGALRPQ